MENWDLFHLRGIGMSKLRESAKGKDCLVRIPGVCNFDPATVVLAHLNGGGMGMKKNDLFGAFCCSSCHDALDGRNNRHSFRRVELDLMHREGVERTQLEWLNSGLVVAK